MEAASPLGRPQDGQEGRAAYHADWHADHADWHAYQADSHAYHADAPRVFAAARAGGPRGVGPVPPQGVGSAGRVLGGAFESGCRGRHGHSHAHLGDGCDHVLGGEGPGEGGVLGPCGPARACGCAWHGGPPKPRESMAGPGLIVSRVIEFVCRMALPRRTSGGASSSSSVAALAALAAAQAFFTSNGDTGFQVSDSVMKACALGPECPGVAASQCVV